VVGSFREYEIISGPSSGTYGEVFVCQHTTLGVKRAVKRLHGFVRPEVIRDEALKQKDVASPYVMQLYDYFESENALLLEYCPIGLDEFLRDRLSQTKGRIPYREAQELLYGILQGLNDAHNAGVIHGDVKPGNIRFGEDELPKLGDFGAAARIQEETGLLRGSSSWMAPEVLRGQGATREADYFSFGLIAYLVLGGRHPFYADDATCLCREDDNICSSTYQPPHISDIRADVPPMVADLIMELLSRAPGDRERAEVSLKAALAPGPDAASAAPEQSSPSQDTKTDLDVEGGLQCSYNEARRLFFVEYRPIHALQIISNSLKDLNLAENAGSRSEVLADLCSLAGFIENSRGQFSEAMEHASDGLNIHPEHVASLHTRGYALLQLRRLADAKVDLERALELAVSPRRREQIRKLLLTVRSRQQESS